MKLNDLPQHLYALFTGIRAIAVSIAIDKDLDKMKFAAFAWLDCNQQFLVETTCCSGEVKQTERKHLIQRHKASLERLDRGNEVGDQGDMMIFTNNALLISDFTYSNSKGFHVNIVVESILKQYF